jgi:hypothetical protein
MAESLEEKVAALEKQVASYKRAADLATQTTENFGNSLDSLTNLGSRSVRSTQGVSTAFEDLTAVATTATDGVSSLGSAVKAIGKIAVGPFDLAGKAVQAFGASISISSALVGNLADGAHKAAKAYVNAFDAPSKGMRRLDREMFDLTKQFGGTIDEAERFSDSLKKETSSEFSRSLFITRGQMQDFMQVTKSTSLTFEQLSESVSTTLGATTLYNVALAASRSMGIDVRDGADLLNTAINKQGMTAEEAAGSFGMFAAVSENVGLRSSTVAKTLNNAVGSFSKLGLQAEFGRPVLEGFGRVMDNMGLGIENATGLTDTLTNSLAKLTTNYGNAYLMFQRGGLDIGGGGGSGVLGASIGLQAAMLDPNTDQAALGADLMGGMRDTLASFAGGEIVTVSDAAEDSSLQSQFYIQQQMLKTQFGINDEQSANRILELLQDFGEAQRTGNVDAQQSLSEQLQREQQGTDKTLDEWEKANRNLEIQSNLLAIVARPALENLRENGAAPVRAAINGIINRVGEALQGKVEGGAALRLSQAATSTNQSILNLMQPGEEGRASRNSSRRGSTPQRAANVVGSTRATPALAAEGIEARREEVINDASMTELNSLGYGTREEFAESLATAISAAVSGVSVDISLTTAASELVRASASLNQQATPSATRN